jgi:cyclopropane-fatty-acyl-phospholipid synthase
MDDYFIRKWNYYLQYCEAAFQQQHITLLQLIYTRPGSKVG